MQVGCVEFDGDCDGDIDLFDYAIFQECVSGESGNALAAGCAAFDSDNDGDVDLIDWGGFQIALAGPGR